MKSRALSPVTPLLLASAPCNNRENCIPVSLYDDAAWHTVEVSITPLVNFGATVSFSLDNGAYSGFGQVQYGFFMPSPTYLGFSARTGGATNNHWVRNVRTTNPPPPPLPETHRMSSFALGGSAYFQGGTLKLARCHIPPPFFTLSVSLTWGVLPLQTQVANSQQGTAFKEISLGAQDAFNVRFLMYCGDGTGADGLCVNVGGRDMAGRVGEDGVAQGVAVCFDEWANNGDHGVSIVYNGDFVWENIANCNNRENCVPVSLFDDALWHSVEVGITPSGGGATVVFEFDNGIYTGAASVENYELSLPAFLGFSARTGGATNNHWVRNVRSGSGDSARNIGLSGGAPSPPLAAALDPGEFVLSGSALLRENVLRLMPIPSSRAVAACPTAH